MLRSFFSVLNLQTGRVRVVPYKSQEPAYVDKIKVSASSRF